MELHAHKKARQGAEKKGKALRYALQKQATGSLEQAHDILHWSGLRILVLAVLKWCISEVKSSE